MPQEPPPVYTLITEILGWTLDRTAGFPKSALFTFGQRLDNLTLDALQSVVRALYGPRRLKRAELDEINLTLEQLRALWRITEARGWISARQLLFIIGRIDEAGRMVGGWLRQIKSAANEP